MAVTVAKQTFQDHKAIIVGLGATGLSVARFLHRHNFDFMVVDDREDPPGYQQLVAEIPSADLYVGLSNEDYFDEANDIVVSPGVSLKLPALRRAAANHKSIIGDIELFAQYVREQSKVVAITGSNGKSTVASLLAQMARQAGVAVAAGGNLGRPALDLLDEAVDLYVLELSSFQLETVSSMRPAASTILNLSEDHLDRYPSMDAYRKAKLRVHRRSECAVINREQRFELELADDTMTVSYGLDAPRGDNIGIVEAGGGPTIARGDEILIACRELALAGPAGILNTQAAFALGYQIGLDQNAMCDAARVFEGLPHRLQKIGLLNGVEWFNDSKATNVGAVICALQTLDKKVILICGGLDKRADFKSLAATAASRVKAFVLLGRDAGRIAAAVDGIAPVHRVDSMRTAVDTAYRISAAGDCVLLSPGCASFDMYHNYAQRGEDFTRLFRELEQ